MPSPTKREREEKIMDRPNPAINAHEINAMRAFCRAVSTNQNADVIHAVASKCHDISPCRLVDGLPIPLHFAAGYGHLDAMHAVKSGG
ncbi:unnamed protein product [Scytosiphon promiscuus]